MTTEEAYRHTLYWVNELRQSAGHEPLTDLPPGPRRSKSPCPVACALEPLPIHIGRTHFVGPVTAYLECPLPYAVHLFVDYFDDSRYPELDVSILRGKAPKKIAVLTTHEELVPA